MPDLIIERAGGVVTATLNRSERKNALTYALFDALGALFDEVSSNEADRVLVLRGAGGAFSSGMDRADRARFFLAIEPSAGRKQVDNRAAVTQPAHCRRQTQVEGTEINQHDEIRLDCHQVSGGAPHRQQQSWNSRHRRQRTHARPTGVIAPNRKSGGPHRGRADAFELSVGIERANRARE